MKRIFDFSSLTRKEQREGLWVENNWKYDFRRKFVIAFKLRLWHVVRINSQVDFRFSTQNVV